MRHGPWHDLIPLYCIVFLSLQRECQNTSVGPWYFNPDLWSVNVVLIILYNIIPFILTMSKTFELP